MDFGIWVGHTGLPLLFCHLLKDFALLCSRNLDWRGWAITILGEIEGGFGMKLLVHVDKFSTCFYTELEESL